LADIFRIIIILFYLFKWLTINNLKLFAFLKLLSLLKFFTKYLNFFVLSINCKLMKHYGCSTWYIKTSCFTSILRYIHKMVTNVSMHRQNSFPLTAQKENSIPSKWLRCNTYTFICNFNPANINIIFNEVFFSIIQILKNLIIHLTWCSLISIKIEKFCNIF